MCILLFSRQKRGTQLAFEPTLVEKIVVDVALYAPQGAHYLVDDICLLPLIGNEEVSMGLWDTKHGLHQLGFWLTFSMSRLTA